MGRSKRAPEDLTIPELQTLLARRRVEARRLRLAQFRASGRALRLEAPSDREISSPRISDSDVEVEVQAVPSRRRTFVNRVLLLVEVLAVVGLVVILLSGLGALRELNSEVAAALEGPTPMATPIIRAVVLPSGHTPPTSPGGAQPNEAEIPENLRPFVESLPVVGIPTPGPEQARSLFIPALWSAAAPVVQGDGWEQLKKGVGQHLGTANPGESGNVVLSAHNDIFGELFRDLDRLKPGDEVRLSTATREYVYRVTGTEIVEPTDVHVMESTARPSVTLISCYPYLVDSKRIVVFAELTNG
ncbi:MAG TPA: class D sortase [Anaerolineales bacterium]|nr:class D sortase [Anaerolineales bacterium]